MKKKAFTKRLVLNKTTVANLDGSQMVAVKGGDSEPILCIETMHKTCTCHTCIYNCTTQDPNQICVNTCTCPNTSQQICIYTECC